MTRNLVPYDPDNQPTPGPGKPEARDEHVHYHYYDQRTFLQDRSGDNPDEDEPFDEPPDAILAPWQKVGLLLIALASIPWLLFHFGLLTVMPSAQTNTSTEYNVADEAGGTAPTAPETTLYWLAGVRATTCSQPDVRETVATRCARKATNRIRTTRWTFWRQRKQLRPTFRPLNRSSHIRLAPLA
jgi:hypothetical protein